MSQLEKGKPIIELTYPRFWQTPEGNLQFSCRRRTSSDGDSMLIDYNSETGTWHNTRLIDSGRGFFQDTVGKSNSRNAYPNGYDYDSQGKLHVTWVWREGPHQANHDLIPHFSYAVRGRR